MKKILWLIILIPIFMTTAWASETYYSDYTNFSDYQEQRVEKSDTVNVEEVTMYKWYKEVKKIGEYKLYNSNENFTNDCYETQYSNWSKTKPQINEPTILDERTMYDYQMIKPIRYIHLYNLDGSYSSFRITELQVLYNQNEIDYTYTCKGCWQDFDKYIHNGIYAENMSIIDDNGSLIIDLGKEYPIDKINLIIYLFDIGDEDKKYTIGFSNDGKNILFNKTFIQQFKLYYAKDSIRYEYGLKDLNVDNNLWLYSSTSEQFLDTDFVYSRTIYKEYRYKEKMCKTYTLTKEYYPQYSMNGVGEYKFKESPKTFYRYQTRDKLQLNIHDITEKNYDLNNFVIFHTDNYTINHNIYWDKNGVYNINFSLNDINVTKSVKVNILSNAIAEKEEEINNLKEQLNNTVEDYKNIIEKLEQNNQEYLNSINDLNIQIIDLNKEIDNIKINSVQQTEEFNKLKQDLELKIELHTEKITNLEELNKNYLENLNKLLNDILNIENKLIDLGNQNQNQDSEISELRIKLDKHIEEYNIKIKHLEEFNNECFIKLEQINVNIKDINEYLQRLEENINQDYEQLNNKIDENTNSIIEIKELLRNQIDEVLKINLEIINIKEQIKDNELNNKKIYENLFNELENSKQEINGNMEDLRIQIEILESDFLKLNNSGQINEQQIKEVQDKMQDIIKQYNLELENLNSFNSLYSGKLDILNSDLKQLEEKIIILNNSENKNNLDIESIKQEMLDYKNEYNKFIDSFTNFSLDYYSNLKEIDNSFKEITANKLTLEIIGNEKFNELNDLINENTLLLEKINNDNKNKYETIIQEQNDINIKLEEDIKKIDEQYINSIEQLKEEIKSLVLEIQKIKGDNRNNHKNLVEYQNLIYEQLIINNNEIISIKQNQVMDKENLETIKNEILNVSTKSNNTKAIEKTDLNSKLNNYMLKINGVELFNLLWFYIILSIIFGIYLIYTFKKSRIKK